MKSILIKNGHLISPANNIDEVCDIFIEGEKIVKIGKNIKEAAAETIDAYGKIVMPGLVDM
ncbi:MAG: dihydroorotase, partial [Candidatus Omnitrophica bacterium]|nr:dihydroorotase [Candidatus Omnitrophota bacterium]